MKNKIYIISTIILAVLGITLFMNFTSDRPNKYQNAFSRRPLKGQFKENARLKIPISTKNICGIANDSIFLSTTTPGQIYMVSADFKHIDSFSIALPFLPNLTPVFNTVVNYPFITIFGSNAKCIIKGNLKDNTYKITRLNIGATNDELEISDASIITGTVDPENYNFQISKLNLQTGQLMSGNPILPALGDAGITYDGVSAIDPVTYNIVYLCYYVK